MGRKYAGPLYTVSHNAIEMKKTIIILISSFPFLLLGQSDKPGLNPSKSHIEITRSGQQFWLAPGSSGQFLTTNGTTISWGDPLSGSGTTNYLAKWASSSTFSASLLYDNGTDIGIGTASPGAKLDIRKALTSAGAQIFRVQDEGTNGYTAIVEGTSQTLAHYPFIEFASIGIDEVGGGFTAIMPTSRDLVGANGTVGAFTFIAQEDDNSALESADVFSINNYATNFFKISATGNVGIITQLPTARLHLPAGTATASTAPLKLTSGSLLSTPETGAFEFLTDRLYFTQTTGATRQALAYSSDLNPLSGSGSPGVAPRWNGDRYFDYTNSKWYSAWDNENGDGTGDGLDSDDWIILN